MAGFVNWNMFISNLMIEFSLEENSIFVRLISEDSAPADLQ